MTGAEAKEFLESQLAITDQGNSILGPARLPPELGYGFAYVLKNAPITDQPYVVIAQFRCGKTRPVLHVAMAQGAKGRDHLKDLTELMRIAQQRFGKLLNCKPGV